MEPKDQNQINLLNSQLSHIEEPLNHEINELHSQLNQNYLNYSNNQEKEIDIRRTCLLNQENTYLNPKLNEAYREYAKFNKENTFLYLIDWIGHVYNKSKQGFESEKSEDVYTMIKFYIYNTEIEKEQVKVQNIPRILAYGTRLVQLPNGELFCYGKKANDPGFSYIIGNDYRVRKLPTGVSYWNSSAIYFSRSIYCFGGFNSIELTLSSRFDLDKNRWIKLASLPEIDKLCSSLVFNRNILISSLWMKTLWLYSIDIDSFSIIHYEFERYKWKIAVNAEDRLYIIECQGLIYESEVGDEYNWKLISKSEIYISPINMFWAYNKGGIYIGCIDDDGDFGSQPISNYYKFSLDEKVLIKLSNPI